MGEGAAVSGPDFSQGVPIDDIPANGTLNGRVGEQPVLLSQFDGKLVAVSGACTHYGAALASGLVDGEAVRCPLHHACFSLRTGRALRGPALDNLDQWQIDVEEGTVFVRNKLKHRKTDNQQRQQQHKSDAKSMVIVGGGGAGVACANELRRLGYSGAITMLSADADPPVDRPNLSKDYLAGTAPAEWMPLRPDKWYSENGIDLRLGTNIVRIDAANRRVQSATGERFAFDRLLLATGSEPNRLGGPGFDDRNVFTLRSFADARAIIERLGSGTRAAIVGSSFIGLEAAAALRKRGVEVHVISPERVPFEGVFGREVGGFLQTLHERNGVRFDLGSTAGSFDTQTVSLANGDRISADFVLVGIGVRPRTALAESAGIVALGGIPVDAFLQTSVPDVYAAGDIAAYPDPLSGEPTRIEHWVTAQRQGQTAARNMLGLNKPYRAVPFFWTEQYGVTLRYVGHARHWNHVVVEGDIESGEFVARYYDQGVHRASAAVGRDLAILEDEREFEGMTARVQVNAARIREPATAAAIK